jgi:hypothetical protein
MAAHHEDVTDGPPAYVVAFTVVRRRIVRQGPEKLEPASDLVDGVR